jgi:hypothetical protein
VTTGSRLLSDQTLQKTCWRCRADFACGAQHATEKCWCDGLPAIQPIGDGSDCLCPACLNDEVLKQQKLPFSTELVEGEDYYREGPAIVFTARYHLRRGTCCGSGCRHCPYKK